jgi:aspartyl protease family protein
MLAGWRRWRTGRAGSAAAAGFVALLLVALPASAQNVSLAGVMGSKALLVIDGQTKVLAVGDSALGVKLLRLQDGSAVVESAGQQGTLRVGGAPARLAGASTPAAAREIIIPAGPGGHFVAAGAINGRAVQFMVDTGATLVSLSEVEAERIGLDYRNGRRMMMSTANGNVAAYEVTLTRLRVGDVELANIGAIVMPAQMPMVLLGNSFLARFQMRRDNDVMRLEVR